MNSPNDPIKTIVGFDMTKVKEALAGRAAEILNNDLSSQSMTSSAKIEILERELAQLAYLNQRLRRKNRNQKIALRQLNDAMIRKSWNLGKALVDRQSLETALDAMFGIKVIK